MTPIRSSRIPTNALMLASILLTAGCAGQNPFTARQTTVGSLKANLASMESENEQLRRQVATLKSDYRRAEEQLVQEKTYSDDLATRLDNAKGLLSSNGGLDSGPEATKSDRGAFSSSDPIPPPRKRAPRKPPAAAIPGYIEPSGDSTSMNEERLWNKSSRTADDANWLPIARGTGSTTHR